MSAFTPAKRALTDLVLRAAGARLRLGRPTTGFGVTRDVEVPMRDWARLRTDVYTPASAPIGTLLIRTPYGRSALMATIVAGLFAGRGYRVVVQSARGTFGSTGTFDPVRNETEDGADTVAWLRAQPWFDGRFATLGSSYLGFTQWALLSDPPPELETSVIAMATHDYGQYAWGAGSFRLSDLLTWTYHLAHQESDGALRGLVRSLTTSREVRVPLDTVPLRDAAARLLAGRTPWFESWVRHQDPADPYWEPARRDVALERVETPVLLIAGWQDILVTSAFQEYAQLAARGVEPALIVGPWTHSDGGGDVLRETLAWLTGPRWSGVRIHVRGADRWRELPSWPPAAQDSEFYLHPRATLASDRPAADGAVAGFVFDPADPTPSLGGRLLFSPNGYQEDSALAARDDVVTFTSAPLTEALEVIGVPRVELAHRTDIGWADVWVRISEVGEDGRSHNVSDGYVRREPGADPVLHLDLDPIAHRFAAGARIRLLIAGGCHPHYARNHGTGEPQWTATRMVPSTHEIGAGSRLLLPVAR